MKKNVVKISLLLIFAVSVLMGCKKNAGTPEDNAVIEADAQSGERSEETDMEYRFGFTCIDMSNPYFNSLQLSIETELSDQGYTLISKDAALDSDLQIQQIQELIDAQVDAVFLCPVDWEEIEPAVQALKEAEIPIVNIDTQVKNIDEVDAFVGSDNKNAGYLCGEDLIERCPNGGRVVILECPTMNSINERITGFEEAIANQGFEIVARIDTQGDLEQSRIAMESLLKEHSDIDAIMCGNDQSALGALVSLGVAQREEILIYGVDGSPDLKKELEKSETAIAGTAAQSPINIGRTAVATALAILSGEDYEKFTFEQTFFINQKNVELYGIDGWQ